ncbi:hypothetical protein AKJ37_06795 [candidate division MSBL1 archaeon SCGC-AAA259I09]|uniref:Type II secretion system protein GspF domain-containing protein n=1 Tax=candidate division MSBL1 archaeon SCGC-AAA259I09 TaxID=1698267 RepID=A0A133UMZ0_9EURY|nr:hypothetical protein AKJ37_06795 [candidate division MSBL1 archaeon SCGC-AAA259I09]
MNFDNLYARFCRFAGRWRSLRDFQKPSNELERNLELIDLGVGPREVIAFAFLGIIFGTVIIGVILGITLILNFSLVTMLVLIPLPVLLYFVIGFYPKWRAEKERNKNLKLFPHLINYLSVSLKINPNLEEAANFSASQDRVRVKDFRSEVWKASIGVYAGVEEALSRFVQRWKEGNKEFKRSVDLLKSSISEKDDSARSKILDRALNTVFEGVQNQMEDFVADIQLPTVMIYGIGVLLPLILLAVLPVLSSSGFQLSGLELALVYCLLIPSVIYFLKKQVLSNRPAAFFSTEIPSEDDFKQAFCLSCAIFLIPTLTVLFLNMSRTIEVMVVLWSLTSGISGFCHLSSEKTLKIRKMNEELEEEFCSALTQLGNQFKRNRPPEDVFRRTAEIMKGSEVSKILKKTSANIRTGGMNTGSALFDDRKGSLNNVHSHTINNTFRMITNLLGRSTRVTGEAILLIANHLKRLTEVEKQIRRTLQDIVSSMKSVVFFFAPLIASITVQLQDLLSEKTKDMVFFGGGLVKVSSSTFLAVLGFYIIILTTVLTSYIVEIENGDDWLLKRVMLAKTIPISMIVFSFGLVIGREILTVLVG